MSTGGSGAVERFLELERSLCAALRSADGEGARRIAWKIFEQEESVHREELDVLRLEVMTVAGILTREAMEVGVPVQVGLQVHNGFRVDVMAAGSQEGLWEGFEQFIEGLVNAVRLHVWDGDAKERLAKEYILQHFHKELTLDEMARVTYMTPSHFSRMFKRWTGLTFTMYLQARRVERAKQLFQEATGLSIARIAELVGYKDAGHFSRIFLSMEGILPSEYRRSVSGKQ